MTSRLRPSSAINCPNFDAVLHTSLTVNGGSADQRVDPNQEAELGDVDPKAQADRSPGC